MKFAFGILAVVLFPSFGLAQAPAAMTISFSDIPKLISEKNENLKAARVNVEAQEKRTGHLTRSFLPHVSANYGSEEFKYGSNATQRKPYWRLGASVNVFRGGRDSIDEEIREKQVVAAKSELVKEYRLELRDAQMAYWDLVAIQKMLVSRQEELKRNDENIRSARKRAGAGVATAADSVQFDLNRATLEQSVRELELRKDASRNKLSVALGLDEHENISVTSDFPKESDSGFADLKVESSAGVRSAQALAEVEGLRAKQAGRWWLPKLDVYGTYGQPSLDDEYDRALRKEKETAVGVVLSLDFGQGFGDYSESGARRLEAKSKSHRVAHLTRETVAADHELRHDIKLAISLIADNEKNVEKARQFLKLTQSEYTRGLKNGPDLMAAFRQYYDLQDRTLQLNRDLQAAKSELESLIAKGF